MVRLRIIACLRRCLNVLMLASACSSPISTRRTASRFRRHHSFELLPYPFRMRVHNLSCLRSALSLEGIHKHIRRNLGFVRFALSADPPARCRQYDRIFSASATPPHSNYGGVRLARFINSWMCNGTWDKPASRDSQMVCCRCGIV
jgi:hypothetical protein